ncbi:MAG TPA: alpha/beta hydrolase [Myxococcota bacterium]|nr:alpha/beta hydrolase [Myxococcota bacterium]
MPTIRSNGVWLHFDQAGEPSWPTVVLVHGFASSADDSWLATGWVKRLGEARRRTVRVDLRGHGRSDKPYDPAAYSLDTYAADLEELLRYANARSVDLFGYSMGARIALGFLERRPDRLRSVILGGIGANVLQGLPENDAVVAALEAPDASKITSPVGRAFRAFAESRGNDLRALAAVRRGARSLPNRQALSQLSLPALVFGGAKDELIGDFAGIAALIPGARSALIPDADHIGAASHPAAFDAVLDFLAGVDRASR